MKLGLGRLIRLNRYPEFARLLWWRTITPYFLRRAGVEIKAGATFMGCPIVSVFPKSRIVIGERANLCSVSEFTALGVNHPVILRTLRPGAIIEIGSDTGISGASICASVKVSVGQSCLFGANVMIADTDFHPLKSENRRYSSDPFEIASSPVIIEDNVFLGTGAIVLKGVFIGKNSVIGAGSIVSKNIPQNSIAAGNPARVIGTVSR